MATWHVVKNLSHGGTNAGTSYANAWTAWGSIVWASIQAGDTLMVWGDWPLTGNLSIGAHGAAAGGEGTAKVIIDFSEATVDNSAGGFYFQNERANTIIRGGVWNAYASRILFLLGSLRCDIEDCTFNGITASAANGIISLSVGNTRNHIDLTIQRNRFSGPVGYSAIDWVHTVSGAVTTLQRVKVLDNTFQDMSTYMGIVNFFGPNGIPGAGSTMQDITISRNTFSRTGGLAIRLSLEFTSFGTSNGFVIEDNVFENLDYSVNRLLVTGGAIYINGFDQSTTAGFGRNRITRNTATEVRGAVGFCNIFFSVADVYRNTVNGGETETIDCCGVLMDHGCQGVRVFDNTFSNLRGIGVGNSGCAVMVLDAIDCEVWNNTSTDCNVGIFFGDRTNAATGGVPYQSANAWNNTFMGCEMGGVWMNTLADKALCVAQNNAFSGPGEKVHLNGGAAWTGESYNAFDSGMGGTTNHTLAASSEVVALDVSIDGTPSLDSALVGAGVHLGYSTDRNGVQRFNPPTIGAIEPPRNRGAASAREAR